MRHRLSMLAACVSLVALPAIAATGNSARSVWPAEMLSGTITIVDPGQNTVVVQGSGGVPFDLVVTRNTRIESGSNHKLTIQELKQDVNRGVTVKFIPEKRGDVARTIQVNG